MGAIVTTRLSPWSSIAATRPIAALVANMTEPTLRSEAPGALGSIAQVSPSALAQRTIAGPPSTSTTSGWYVTDGSRVGPRPYAAVASSGVRLDDATTPGLPTAAAGLAGTSVSLTALLLS